MLSTSTHLPALALTLLLCLVSCHNQTSSLADSKGGECSYEETEVRQWLTDLSVSIETLDAGRLDLSSKKLAEADLERLCALPLLKELDLSSNALTGIAPLARLKNLENLRLASNAISSLEPIKNLRELSTLSLKYNGIDRTTGRIRDDALSSLSPLRDLVKLKVLDLDGNRIPATELVHLIRLTELHELHLHKNEMRGKIELPPLPSLNIVYLDGNLLTDVSGLAQLDPKVTITVDGNPIPNDSAVCPILSAQPSLNRNCLRYYVKPSASDQNQWLAQKNAVYNNEHLDLSGRVLGELDYYFVKSFTTLRSVDISRVQASDSALRPIMTMLSRISSLESLKAEEAGLTAATLATFFGSAPSEIFVVQPHPNLKVLNLRGNPLTGVYTVPSPWDDVPSQPFVGLTALQELDITGARLDSVYLQNLLGLTTLHKLGISPEVLIENSDFEEALRASLPGLIVNGN